MSKISEEKIRPEEIFTKFLQLCAHDAETFFSESEKHLIDCPACGNPDGQIAFTKHGFVYRECPNCQSLYVSPRPHNEAMHRYYAESESAGFWAGSVIEKTRESRNAAIVSPNIDRIADLFEERSADAHKIIDVGAGMGGFLKGWKALFSNATPMAIEPGGDGAQACRALGATVFEGMVEDAPEDFHQCGDLVTCFEVIEHAQNPQQFAHSIFKLVAPGGLAVVTGLGVEGFDIQLLWDKSRSVMPPHHLNFMSVAGFDTLFKSVGFETVEILTPGRLDVDIMMQAVARGESDGGSRFDKLLLSRGKETQAAFQRFLVEHQLSSHVWIVCKRAG